MRAGYKNTGYTIAGWSVMLADSGMLFLMNDAEITSMPDPRGTHPANWHPTHRWGPAYCPYCYAGQNPGEIRSILEKYLEEL